MPPVWSDTSRSRVADKQVTLEMPLDRYIKQPPADKEETSFDLSVNNSVGMVFSCL